MADDKEKSRLVERPDGDESASPTRPVAHSPTHPHPRHEPRLCGVMAEFEGPNELVHAPRRTYEEGYRRINGYSPYPIEELSEAIGFTHSALPLIVFIGGGGGVSRGGVLSVGRAHA